MIKNEDVYNYYVPELIYHQTQTTYLKGHVALSTKLILGIIWNNIHLSQTRSDHDIFRESLEMGKAIRETVND